MSAARPKAAEKPNPSMGWSLLLKSADPTVPGGEPSVAAADRVPMVSVTVVARTPTAVQRFDRARSVLIIPSGAGDFEIFRYEGETSIECTESGAGDER